MLGMYIPGIIYTRYIRVYLVCIYIYIYIYIRIYSSTVPGM